MIPRQVQKVRGTPAFSTARTSAGLNPLGPSLRFPVSQAPTPEQGLPCFEEAGRIGQAPAPGLTLTLEASGVQPPLSSAMSGLALPPR